MEREKCLSWHLFYAYENFPFTFTPLLRDGGDLFRASLIPLVGYDITTIDLIYKELTASEPPGTCVTAKDDLTTDKIKSAIRKMKDMVLYYSSDNFIGVDLPTSYNEAVNEILELDKEIFLTWSIRNLLYERINANLSIEMLNRIENILLLQHSEDNAEYVAAVISTSFYLYFEQNTYDIGYSLDFCNHVFYRLKKAPDVNFYENLLLPYLDKSAFFDRDTKRAAHAYMALDTLLAVKSIPAYFFTKNLLLQKNIGILSPPSPNYWDFNLRRFYNALWKGNIVERPVDDIGYDWEFLCQRIVKTYYEDTRANYEGICLENGSIPDIVSGTIQYDDRGKIIHVKKIIECKKSLYFVELGTVLNNDL